MSLLKDKKRSRPKNSAKLPKLTIQEQIDNNEVIERMNRKIAFTKNQRHLGSTITYNEALTSNPNKDFLLTGSKTGQGGKFKSVPQQIIFNHYQLHRIYESQIKLINQSHYLQRIKITPLSKKQFNIFNVTYPKDDSGDIAPGMAATITIRFKPINLGDIEEQLIIIFNGGTIRIPILAMRERPCLVWPKIIDCGHCWVGNHQQHTVTVQNTGGQVDYYLVAPQLKKNQFNKQNPGVYQINYFTIIPTVLKFHKQSKQKITVKFSPQSKGNFNQTITFKSNQGQEQQIHIKLKGGAYNAQLILEKINGQILKQQSTQYNLYINNTEVNKLSHAQVTIQNLAVVDVDYEWFFNSSLTNQKNIYGQNIIQISDQKGKLTASSSVNFEINFLPQNRIPQNIKAELYLFNLPEKSLINKSQVKNINGVQAIQCLVLNIKTRSIQSSVRVFPLHKQATAPLYKQTPITEQFTIMNYSSSQRKYKITLITASQNCILQLISHSQGTLQQSESKKIQFLFGIKELTKQQQKGYFLIEFDNCAGKIFSIGGFVQYPEIQLSQTQLFFGVCKTYTKIKKQLILKNDQGSSASFKITNPIQFHELDFYEFYEFDEEEARQYKPKRLTIKISDEQVIKQDCQYTIEAGKQMSLIFEYSTRSCESVNQSIWIQTINGKLTQIPLILLIQQIQCQISRNQIDLRTIFKGNTYNSNKFLSKQLSILNKSSIQTTFEFQTIDQSTCSIKINPMKFTLPPKTKKRIDLLLEPIKTGEWNQVIKWNYYDDFKINPQNYPQLSNLSFNSDYDCYSKSFIKHETLKLKAEIKGVQIKYYIKDQTRAKRVRQKIDDLATSVKHSTMSFKSSRTNLHEQEKIVYPYLEQLNFYNCEINQVRQLQIMIQNDSSLTTQFSIYAQSFHTLQKGQSESKNQQSLQDEEAFSSQMGKTFLQARKLDKSQKVHLSNNKGISIMCDPPAAILHKKQTQKILITMFNDTSGRFKDFLVIQIKDHEIKKFPIDIHVKGSPVVLSKNQLGIDFNYEVPVMNLGCVLVGNGQLKKNIRVVNKGPKQVNLQWLIYPHNQHKKDEDIFKLKFDEAAPGISDIVDVKWQAIQPQIDIKSPFIIEPRQKTLKGRQEISFTLIVKQLSKLKKYQNLLICQPELRDGQRQVKMENLAVIVETECVKPILSMDVEHSNQINMFQIFATQHINKENQTSSSNHLRKIRLKNQQKITLQFQVFIQSTPTQIQSFKILAINTNSPNNPYDPNKTFFLGKKLTLTFDSFIQILVQLKANKKDFKDWPLQPKTRKEGKILFKFSNQQTQQISLVGWLFRPWVQVQMSNNLLYSIQNTLIDFGTIHVKNSKKLSIYLINSSKSDAKFTITYIKYQQSKKINFQKSLWTRQDYEDETITDMKQCFYISQDSGVVLNNSIPVHYMPGTLALPSNQDKYTQTHKPIKIDFLFKPKANAFYKSKFRISIEDSIYYDIVVKGRGSFQEQFQIK